MADARKDTRSLLSLKIRYKSATLEDFIERYSIDISRGGVFIKAKKPLAVGTLLKFEFMLQDQSRLIHGVGRVVWRRDETEADAQNPSGMGIKFIKMDAESRSIVQRIAEDRVHPGVFEQGKEGARLGSDPGSQPGDLDEADRTKVRHVSEFLASALEEGGAGEAARREAKAGAERARQVSNQISDQRTAAARGAFSAHKDTSSRRRSAISDSPSRGAMSAFGGSGMSGRVDGSNAAARAMTELDVEDDYFEEESTSIRDPFESDYPDVDATVVAKDAALAFVAERRATPVVPTDSRSPLQDAVPDLFGPADGGFGPAPGEFIDPRLLDPNFVTVPPGRRPVPEAPGIPSEAFRVPQAPSPVRTAPPREKAGRGWILLVLFVLLLVTAAVGVWQLGLAGELRDLAAPYLGQPAERVERPVAQTAVPKPAPAEEPSAEAATEEPSAAADKPQPVAAKQADTDVDQAPVDAPPTQLVKFEVLSRPSGAFVSVNGKGVGRTPLKLEYEVGTELSIYSKARGYLARKQQITVGADQEPVNLVLPLLPYVVEVVTEPAGARASAVGGGQITTPGELQFKAMLGPQKIVIAKDGYKTATRTVTRGEFIEQTSRLAATVKVTLEKDGTAKPMEAAPSSEPGAPTPSEPTVKAEAAPSAKPAPSEAEVAEAPPAAPKPVTPTPAPPAPSETTPADAP